MTLAPPSLLRSGKVDFSAYKTGAKSETMKKFFGSLDSHEKKDGVITLEEWLKIMGQISAKVKETQTRTRPALDHAHSTHNWQPHMPCTHHASGRNNRHVHTTHVAPTPHPRHAHTPHTSETRKATSEVRAAASR